MADKEPWDDDLEREIETDLDLETQENIARGMSPDEARYAARRALGNRLLIQEEVARLHRPNLRVFADTLLQDVRHALRLFRRTPGFSLLATLTLALGIGAVTTIYSVLHGILFAPFPYAHQDRMVDVFVQDLSRPNSLRGSLSVPEFLDFRDQSHAFEAVAGTSAQNMLVTLKDGAENLAVVNVTPDAFDYLGVTPLIGRGIDQRDGQPGAPDVVVLSHKLWVSHFSLSSDVVGQTMTIGGVPRTIVGVMPPRFAWWVADVWIPAVLDRAAKDANTPRFFLQARLKPGVTIEAAEAELQAIAMQRARLYPNEYPKQFRIDVITIIDWVVGRYRGVLYTLFAAVGLLLLIACCNVANMLLARATTREREMAVRAALGAGRLRIMRQLFIESLLLAAAGGIGGVLIAYAGLEALTLVMPRQNVPYETALEIDGTVLLVTLAVSLGAAFLFGLAPALHGAQRELVAGLKAGGKGVAGAAFRHRALRNALVVAEIALSLVLLLGAGLLMRSFIRLMSVDLGIDTSNVLVVPLSFPEKQDPLERERFLQQVASRVAALPGVAAADYTNTIPPYGGPQSDVEIPGTPQPQPPKSLVQTVSGTYVSTFDLRIVHGRFWSPLEGQSGRRLAVVNQAFADQYLAGRDPIGQTVVVTRLREPNAPEPIFEIVGVLANVRNTGPRNPTAPEILIPSSTTTRFGRVLVLRTAVPPLQMLNSVRREIWAVDRRVASTGADELDTMLLRFNYAQPRFSLIILTVFAGVGLVLVAIGVYGVLAYIIAQQTQELAVRVALGASRTHVVHIVLRLGLRLIAGGIVVGVIASFATNRLIANQLWNTSPTDALTLVLAIATITMIGVLACGVPAWRALRIDPMQALRHD